MTQLLNNDLNEWTSDCTVSQKSMKSSMKKLQKMHCKH